MKAPRLEIVNCSKPNGLEIFGCVSSRGSARRAVQSSLSVHSGPPIWYLLGEVRTARCAVRAAFRGASTGLERLAGQCLPTTARGRGRRRYLFRTMVELVVVRRVAPRTGAQRFPLGPYPVSSAAERACAAEATDPTRRTADIPVKESLRGDPASASQRRGVVAARQPLLQNTYRASCPADSPDSFAVNSRGPLWPRTIGSGKTVDFAPGFLYKSGWSGVYSLN